MPINLGRRIRRQIVLALTSECACDRTIRNAVTAARRAGLSRAEIDRAQAGSSFSARERAAVALACAVRSGDPTRVNRARQSAQAYGLSRREIGQVERFARQTLEGLRDGQSPA